MTDLQDKAIDIRGKSYILVKDRIIAFNEAYPNGMIETKLEWHEGGKYIVKATVVPDIAHPERYFTGYSQADESQGMINKTSALENAETSACGRALAMMGIGVIESVASADEMVKAGAATNEGKQAAALARTQAKLDAKFNTPAEQEMSDVMDEAELEARTCSIHDAPLKQGFSRTKVDANGNPKEYWYHDDPSGRCFGD
jgi:hypothetical protein